MFFIGFSILSYPIRPRATKSIGYTKPYTKPSQSKTLSSSIQIIILYESNTVPIKKAEFLRVASLSKLENTVNNKCIFNTKYAESSAKWQVLIYFHNSTCEHSHHYNLHQKSVPLLHSMFGSLFYPYLFKKSSEHSPLTLFSSIPQQFFTSLFLRTITPTIYTKNVFSTSAIVPIQAAS